VEHISSIIAAEMGNGGGGGGMTPDMAAYWKRLQEMRTAYLPQLQQTFVHVQRKAQESGASAGPGKERAAQFLLWMDTSLIPTLQQTAEHPFAKSKHTAEELDTLEVQAGARTRPSFISTKTLLGVERWVFFK
jgi:hypothetical protein